MTTTMTMPTTMMKMAMTTTTMMQIMMKMTTKMTAMMMTTMKMTTTTMIMTFIFVLDIQKCRSFQTFLPEKPIRRLGIFEALLGQGCVCVCVLARVRVLLRSSLFSRFSCSPFLVLLFTCACACTWLFAVICGMVLQKRAHGFDLRVQGP